MISEAPVLTPEQARRAYFAHVNGMCWPCATGRYCRTRELLDTAASIADHEHARVVTGVRG